MDDIDKGIYNALFFISIKHTKHKPAADRMFAALDYLI